MKKPSPPSILYWEPWFTFIADKTVKPNIKRFLLKNLPERGVKALSELLFNLKNAKIPVDEKLHNRLLKLRFVSNTYLRSNSNKRRRQLLATVQGLRLVHVLTTRILPLVKT